MAMSDPLPPDVEELFARAAGLPAADKGAG